MKVSMKELLDKLLNWKGLEFTWDWDTLNTTDTWMPVLTGKTIQHRVVPARLGDIVQVKYVSLGSQSIAGNSVKSINLWNACVNAAPSGYTFVGVAGFSTNHGSVAMVSARPTNSVYSFECRNTVGTALTFSPEVWAMYTRNAM